MERLISWEKELPDRAVSSHTVDRYKTWWEWWCHNLRELEVCMSVTCQLVFVSPDPRWSLLDCKTVCLLLYWDKSVFLLEFLCSLVMHSFGIFNFFVFFLSFCLQTKFVKIRFILFSVFGVFAWNKCVSSSLETGIRGVYEWLCGCWALNLGPLEEQTVLLTPEPTLQPTNNNLLL